MKIWVGVYRWWLVIWISCALIACGNADKTKPKLGIVSPPFDQIKDRSDDIEVQFKLTDVGINCGMSLGVNLKLKDSSCSSIPQGSHVYRLEYYDKTNNTMIAWAEDNFTLGDSDMDIFPKLTSEIDDDEDGHSNLDEFIAGTNPKDASDYPPPSLTALTDPPEPVCNAPANVTIEARDKLTVPTATELGKASGLNFTGEVTVSHDVPATGFDIDDHTVTWTCADSSTEKTTTQTVTIKNVKPIANAGTDQVVQVGDDVTLDASTSSDPNKDNLNYLWTTLVDISLSSVTAVQPKFTVAIGTKAGVLTFGLSVNDGQGGTASDSVEINILNTAPSAITGSDRTIVINNKVNLDGSASSDVNGDTLIYRWSVVTYPAGSTATLVDPNIVTASFTPDVVGSYTLQLEVNDGLSSAINSLVLTVIETSVLPQPEMVIIPRGEFQMGDESSPDGTTKGVGDSNELPVHMVTVADFEMGKYEVTVAEFRQFADTTNYMTDAEKNSSGAEGCYLLGVGGWTVGSSWRSVGFIQFENDPVVCVSWNDAKEYIRWLNQQTGLTYRLATEAEWEYAARGRITAAYSWGNTIDHDRANYGSNSCCDGLSVDGTKDVYLNTAPVGQFTANPFGLHDMHGNVWEWVEDCWHNNYKDAPSDGSAWVTNCANSRRVLRGGSWGNERRGLRSASRSNITTDYRNYYNGFRLARTP